MRRIAAVACTLFICLALVGVGYALWSENLVIDGTVNTGRLDWAVETAMLWDMFPPPPMSGPGTVPDWTCDPGFGSIRMGDKNVGWGGATITNGGNTVDLVLQNVYPSYFNTLAVYPINTGTIPLHIERVRIKNDAGDVVYELTEHSTQILYLDLNGDTKNDLELRWGNNFGLQLHPGDEPPEISMQMHVLQECPEGAELHFSIEIEAVQWNESIHPYVP